MNKLFAAAAQASSKFHKVVSVKTDKAGNPHFEVVTGSGKPYLGKYDDGTPRLFTKAEFFKRLENEWELRVEPTEAQIDTLITSEGVITNDAQALEAVFGGAQFTWTGGDQRPELV